MHDTVDSISRTDVQDKSEVFEGTEISLGIPICKNAFWGSEFVGVKDMR